MRIREPLTTFTVKVFTRHSDDCKYANDPQYRNCNCRKSLSIYDGGTVSYKSARTRSWKEAEEVAQGERDLRNPVAVALAQIEAQEAEKARAAAALDAGKISVSDALDRWLAGHKGNAKGTMKVYGVFVRKVKAWAANEGIVALADVTPAALDLWRSRWSPDAEREDDRMAPTTQWNFQSRLKGFFARATKLRLIPFDPSAHLSPIQPSDEETMPLTLEQFDQLLAATEKHDAAQRYKKGKVSKELYTLFLIQRWTGLRISDVLQMRRDYFRGNFVSLITLKTKVLYEGTVPDLVLDAIAEHLPPRHGVHPDYLFWSRKNTAETLLSIWEKRIDRLNKHLNFKDEDGQPMKFRSHMLRDTFAVQLLLADEPIENVSRLLTHKDIAMTQRYYARWIKARRVKLQNDLVAAMRRMGVTVSV